jgi:hypothetical protein
MSEKTYLSLILGSLVLSNVIAAFWFPFHVSVLAPIQVFLFLPVIIKWLMVITEKVDDISHR